MRKLEKGSADTFLLAAAETDEEEARASAASDGFDTEFDIRAGSMRQDGFLKVDTRPARSFRTGCASFSIPPSVRANRRRIEPNQPVTKVRDDLPRPTQVVPHGAIAPGGRRDAGYAKVTFGTPTQDF
jgi:hypothetical protein